MSITVELCSPTDIRTNWTVCDCHFTSRGNHRLHEVREIRRFVGTSSTGARRHTLGVSSVPVDTAASTRLRSQAYCFMHCCNAAGQVMLFIQSCRRTTFYRAMLRWHGIMLWACVGLPVCSSACHKSVLLLLWNVKIFTKETSVLRRCSTKLVQCRIIV